MGLPWSKSLPCGLHAFKDWLNCGWRRPASLRAGVASGYRGWSDQRHGKIRESPLATSSCSRHLEPASSFAGSRECTSVGKPCMRGADLEVSAYAGVGIADLSDAGGVRRHRGYDPMHPQAVEFLPCWCVALHLYGPDGGLSHSVPSDLSVRVFSGVVELADREASSSHSGLRVRYTPRSSPQPFPLHTHVSRRCTC